MMTRFAATLLTVVLQFCIGFGVRAGEPLVVDLWPGSAPDETGTIGDEYVRASPVLTRDKTDCRPDFSVAAYSGYLKAKEKDELAPGLRIPARTPPIFLVHGSDDIISST